MCLLFIFTNVIPSVTLFSQRQGMNAVKRCSSQSASALLNFAKTISEKNSALSRTRIRFAFKTNSKESEKFLKFLIAIFSVWRDENLVEGQIKLNSNYSSRRINKNNNLDKWISIRSHKCWTHILKLKHLHNRSFRTVERSCIPKHLIN